MVESQILEKANNIAKVLRHTLPAMKGKCNLEIRHATRHRSNKNQTFITDNQSYVQDNSTYHNTDYSMRETISYNFQPLSFTGEELLFLWYT